MYLKIIQLFSYEIEYNSSYILTIHPNYVTFKEAKELCALQTGYLYQPESATDSDLLENLLSASKVSLTHFN